MTQGACHSAMLQSEAYPERTSAIEFRETHISRLYFTDRHVYKVKKPVDFGFLNFTTLDRRRFYCHEEVRLNRRFCPNTYLGVVDIRRHGEGIRIDGQGEIVDYAVLMERLPERRMLTRLLAEKDPELSAQMKRLGRRLARLHRESPVCRPAGGQTNLDIVRFNWQENFQQTSAAVGETLLHQGLRQCSSYVERFLDSHGGLLRQREEEGFVREGHGDLHAEHVCLTDPICIYDCIEFNRRFRVADISADLAFLLMDLDLRRRPDLSAVLLASYLDCIGGGEETFRFLLPFYKTYRAYVRGKVESFTALDADVAEEQRRRCRQRATAYFNLCLAYLCPPTMVLTCGLMGTGKTTLAQALADLLQGRLLRSDVLRKELAGIAPGQRRHEAYGRGIYDRAATEKTYARLLDRALATVAAGRTAIVDASFGEAKQRERFRQAARKAKIPLVLLAIECDHETALARLDRRQHEGADASDGRRELFHRQLAAFDTVSAAEKAIRVDTEGELDYTVQSVLVGILEEAGRRI